MEEVCGTKTGLVCTLFKLPPDDSVLSDFKSMTPVFVATERLLLHFIPCYAVNHLVADILVKILFKFPVQPPWLNQLIWFMFPPHQKISQFP